MNYKIKQIKWWFGFTGFTLYPYIFDVKQQADIPHEVIHLKQQYLFYKYGWYLGVALWLFLYFCVLPYKWHPFRTKWELEPYIKGSGYSEKRAKQIIKEKYYKKV